MTDLSNTFKDAVQATRRLGFRYVWIDSLCIIQGDEADWNAQASKMALVYCEATLTIAAADSKEGTGGLFFERDHPRCLDIPQTEMFVCFGGKGPHTMRLSLLIAKTDRAPEAQHPLFYRKWCLQERMISRRVLYYARPELVWECRMEVQCECNRWYDPPGPTDKVDFVRLTSPPTAQGLYAQPHDQAMAPIRHVFNAALSVPAIKKKHDKNSLMALWSELDEESSVRAVTHGADVLPTMSAMAQNFVDKGLGKYRAGIWSQDMVDQLLWKVEMRPKPTRYDPLSAPTWSWACMSGKVRMVLALWRGDARLGDRRCTRRCNAL